MMSSWKIATINVQGINNQEKFNDVIHWIDSNNIDITILTETKLSPTTAFFYFTNQKKYTTHWTQDPDRPKGSGVGIILNRDKIGRHEYRFEHHYGRLITVYTKFKGKITCQITGVYAPASPEPTEKHTKEKIINYLRTLTSDDTKLNIVAGDLNEDPDHHTCTNIIDTLGGNGLYNMNQNLDSTDFTWKNNSGTMRMLDYIFVSNDMAALETNITTISSLSYFNSDHRIVLARLELDHILLNNSRARNCRHQHCTEKVICTEKTKAEHWDQYKERTASDFVIPFENNPGISTQQAYLDTATQLLSIAQETLRWRKTGNGGYNRHTETETLIHKGRTLVSKIRKTISHPTSLLERNKHLTSLQALFPDISWTGPFPMHSEDFINHVTTKWRDLKRSLYGRKSREDHKRIMQAITQREDNFKENKGKMLKSALN